VGGLGWVASKVGSRKGGPLSLAPPELETISLADSGPIVRLSTGSPPNEISIVCRRVITLVGSRDGCKVVLKNRRVDPVHLAVIHTGDAVFAVDLLSRNGTLLNGLKLQFEKLRDGDRLTIGPWEFRVGIETALPSADADLHRVGLEPAPQIVALEHMPTHRILQPAREACLLGRRNGCDIIVQDHSASRVHAILFRYHGFPAICDLLSRNPTQVNRGPVTFQVLRNDDLVTIGETEFRVRLHTAGVQDRVTKTKSVPATSVKPPSTVNDPDLIDIHLTESSQRWTIVDDYERATR